MQYMSTISSPIQTPADVAVTAVAAAVAGAVFVKHCLHTCRQHCIHMHNSLQCIIL